jgi:ABC-type sugar transport system ATPase subunit
MTDDQQTPIALAAKEVSKHFGGIFALNKVTIEFPTGSSTAIMGDNGAGKSTLMKILSGVHSPDEGSIEVFGESSRLTAPSDARAAGIETVYQDLALSDRRDVAANMFLGRELTRNLGPMRFLALKRMRREAEQSLRALQVEIPSVRREIRTLSGGQRQAVAIARAVHSGCRVLIMDEPMAALGLREASRVQDLIKSLGDRGITRIIVMHNLEHAFAVTERIAVFRQGRIVACLDTARTTPAEVLHLINGLPASSVGVPANTERRVADDSGSEF